MSNSRDEHPNHQHPDPAGQDEELFEGSMDPAQRSLAQALRLSFRVLTVLMVFVLGAFAATGFEEIPSGHVGLIKVFGEIVDEAEPGIAFTWPFPIGSIETVYVEPRTTPIDRFWPRVSARDMARSGGSLKGVNLNTPGLRPGVDGALLTGDRSLYMVKLEVTWEVTDAEVFATRLASPEETIRNLVSEAAIQAAAGRTAESIRRDVSPEGTPGSPDQAMLALSSFSRQIQQGAQRSLDDLQSGIRIVQISIPNYSWHPRALGAYEEAQRRFQDMDARINRARRDAAESLRQAAGTAYVELVGEPGSPNQRPRDYPEDKEYNLIGQYNLARDAGDIDQAEQILARINRVLQSASLGGEARMLIAEAESYRTGVEQAAKQRANRFLSLLETYQNPQFRQMLLSRLWDATRQRIFANPLVERNFLPPNQQTVRLLVPRDATASKEARRRQNQENSDQDGS